MASQTRPHASEEERRHKIRTLVIATTASGTAAVVTSQFWIAGTWVAAAVTPVLVTLISELLNRPTAAIATRLTSERDALPPKPTRSEELLDEEPARAPAEAPVNVYRSGGGRGARPRPRARKKIAVGAVAAVAALAFAITAVAMTGTELITGGSIGKGSGKTTLWSSGDDKRADESQDTRTTPSEQDRQQDTDPDQQAPEQTTPETEPQTAPEEQDTEQTVPEQTAPAPRSAPPTSTSP